MNPDELERIRTSDDPQMEAWNVGYEHGCEGREYTNVFIEGGELHHWYEKGYAAGKRSRPQEGGRATGWYKTLPAGFPCIVCLCGSTRFWREFQRAGLEETLKGNIVLSIGAASGTDDEHFGNLPREEYDRVKTMLDNLHLRKIDLADEVLILNKDGYIGESTRRELEYALSQHKIIRFLEPSDQVKL